MLLQGKERLAVDDVLEHDHAGLSVDALHPHMVNGAPIGNRLVAPVEVVDDLHGLVALHAGDVVRQGVGGIAQLRVAHGQEQEPAHRAAGEHIGPSGSAATRVPPARETCTGRA